MRRSIYTAIMATVCLFVAAAPENFTVKPTGWTKLVRGSEAILYKSPTPTSPKLVYNFEKMIYMDPYTSIRWTTSQPSQDEEYLYLNGVCPVLSEKNGWIEVPEPGIEKNVWVKASKDCWILDPDPIVAGENCSDNFTWIDSPGDPAGGNYAIFLEPGRMGIHGFIYLGRLVDGMIVCPYVISYHVDYNNNTIALGEDEASGLKITSSQLNDDLSPNLSRIGDRILDAIWTGAQKMEQPVVIFKSPNGEGYRQTVYIEK